MRFEKKFILCVLVLVLGRFASVEATRPAFFRNDVDMFMHADAVVQAVVKQSRRWADGASRHLVAGYVITDVFKGDVRKDEVLIVTDSCIDRPIPTDFAGSPRVEDYCRDGLNLRLTGVHTENGTPAMEQGERPKVILFLKKNIQPGAPELTWLEVSRTGYYGPCRQTREDIPEVQTEQFDRLLEKLEANGNR